MTKQKRSPYDRIRAAAVQAVAEQYQCSDGWVRSCITGKETTGNAAAVKASYAEKYKALSEVLK